MTTPVLQVSHLRKQFGDFTAVDDVSFAIRPGEILGLLGPNGAGKTTTIHMMLGLITPTAGSIQVFGMDLATHREQILQAVNFSSTYISMPLALTVEENLWVVARLYGLTDIKRRVDEIVAFEQQCGAVSLCAGIGEAVAKIEVRRMPALAVSLETFDRTAPDAFIDGKLGDFTLQ